MVAGSQDKGATSFEAVLGRLKEASNTLSDHEFAEVALGKRQSAISNAKSRRAVPPVWIEIVAKKYGVSADWLFFGTGPKLRQQRDSGCSESTTPQASHCSNCSALESDLRKERELTRDLVVENRQLWRENRDLSVELAHARAAAAESEEESRRSA